MAFGGRCHVATPLWNNPSFFNVQMLILTGKNKPLPVSMPSLLCHAWNFNSVIYYWQSLCFELWNKVKIIHNTYAQFHNSLKPGFDAKYCWNCAAVNPGGQDAWGALWYVPNSSLNWNHCRMPKMLNRWWRIVTRSPQGCTVTFCFRQNSSQGPSNCGTRFSPRGVSNTVMQRNTSHSGHRINAVGQHTEIRDQLIMVICKVINFGIKPLFDSS